MKERTKPKNFVLIYTIVVVVILKALCSIAVELGCVDLCYKYLESV